MDPKSKAGFSLIELMIALVILGVLLTLALPSFSELIANNRLTAQANDFITAVNVARAEAIRRGAPVCIKRDSATDGVWSEGWTVFVDGVTTRTITNEADRCKTAGVTIQKYSALAGGNMMQSSDFEVAIRYNALGVAVDKDDVGLSGQINLCRQDKNASRSKLLNISFTGTVSVSTAAPTCI